MERGRVLLNTAYFPPIQYYDKIYNNNDVLIEQYETYGKQSYRNRCDIYGANGVLTLSVPVVKGAKKKILTKDIKIEYVTDWRKNHLKSIESAYSRSPYYEYYIDDIIPLFDKKYDFLLDLNNDIMSVVNEILDISPNVMMTDDYIQDIADVDDWRDGIHPKKSKIKRADNFVCKQYTQVFSDRLGFKPNLSILDLIFNSGPESADVLAAD